MLFASLGMVIIGNGFFKPNISTLLGNLYNAEELKPKKDSAYNIFYMGINIGAFICNFVAAYLRNHYSWGYAFAAAGVGMLIGIVWFVAGMRYVTSADVIKPVQPGDMPFYADRALGLRARARRRRHRLVRAAMNLSAAYAPRHATSNDAFIFACVPIVVFYLYLWCRAKGLDRQRIGTLLIMFGVVDPLLEHLQPERHGADDLGRQLHASRDADERSSGCSSRSTWRRRRHHAASDVPVLDDHFRTQLGPDGTVDHAQGARSLLPQPGEESWPPPGQRSEA